MSKIIFVTGTDTGVGKTLVTALLLDHLRESGVRALAMKPFCCGGRGDVKILQSLQEGELTDSEANPYYFAEPIAPLVAARKHRRAIPLGAVLERIQEVAGKCDYLLVEGCGGLMVPLGRGYGVADLIDCLKCDVVLVCRNKLGTINHTLLSVRVLRSLRRKPIRIVLSEERFRDVSSRTNKKILTELLSPIPVIGLSLLIGNPIRKGGIKKYARKLKKTLARIGGIDNL